MRNGINVARKKLLWKENEGPQNLIIEGISKPDPNARATQAFHDYALGGVEENGLVDPRRRDRHVAVVKELD